MDTAKKDPRQYPAGEYRLVMEVHVRGREAVPFKTTIAKQNGPFYFREISINYSGPHAEWPLSTTPEPNWGKLFAEHDAEMAKRGLMRVPVPDDASSLTESPAEDEDEEEEEEEEDFPHMPEPTGVMAFITDRGRRVVIPRESVAWVSFEVYDPDGNNVEALPGGREDEQHTDEDAKGGEH